MSADRDQPPPDAVSVRVEIAAPPERVFRALTDPSELAAWWEPGALPAAPARGAPDAHDWELDVRPGGRWRVHLGDAVGDASGDVSGDAATLGGEYLTVDPPRRLEHTWEASWDDAGPSTVRYDLEPAVVDGEPGTRVTVTHTRRPVRPNARLDLRAGAPAWATRRPRARSAHLHQA